MNFFQVFKIFYNWLAIAIFGLILLFVLLNISLGAIYIIKDYARRNPLPYHGNKLFTDDGKPIQNGQRNPDELGWFDFNSCREVGEQYASDVLDDFYQLGLKSLFSQKGWVRFSYPAFHGKKTNIVLGERGFAYRKTLNPPRSNNKPVVRIFAVGGSTTGGTYISDEHTWPSFLSQILNEQAKLQRKPFSIEVTNFGRPGYYLSKEAELVFDLLRSGYRPSLVIFLDGYNMGDFEDDVPTITDKLGDDFLSCYYFKRCNLENLLLPVKLLPVYRLAKSISHRLNPNTVEPTGPRSTNTTQTLNEDPQTIVERFIRNKKLINGICTVYGAKTLFFLQPHPLYKYDLRLFRPELQKQIIEGNDCMLTNSVYEIMRQNKEFIDISTLYKEFGSNKKAFVDDYHYSPAFNKLLAENIAANINLDVLNPMTEVFNESKENDIVTLTEINTDF